MREGSSRRQATQNSAQRPVWKAICYLAAVVIPASLLAGLVWHLAAQPDLPEPAVADTVSQPGAGRPQAQFALPPIAPSGFRNTSKQVGWTGNRACLTCHPDEHQSYLQTTHSRSLAEVDESREPPDGEFFHELSGRHYRIQREGRSLKLSEWIPDELGHPLVLAEHVAKYALGSGNYARMYLVPVDDFLIEAPVTWYPRRNTWGMSAGYEKDPLQVGFGREVDSVCLNCHAGQVTNIDGAALRLHVDEMAISCERCHGPGALHVKERQAELPIKDKFDDSIVNLRHLSRERQEDVCAQCHLSGAADVNVRGRAKSDFRPGQRLSDFVVTYRIDRPESFMTVSGQIQQMRLSRCYQASPEMSCMTCHDPHGVPEESKKIDTYRHKCLTCHETQPCKLPEQTRRRKDAADYCVTCHMPRGPTDIPHFSFTHHRIGIHSAKTESERLTAADKLVPATDVSHFPNHEQLRLLGLANDVFAGKLAGGLNDESRDDPAYRKLAIVFAERARQLLEMVETEGMRDPEIEAYLSRQNWRRDPRVCIAYGESALKSPDITPAIRGPVIYHLASSWFDQRKYTEAFPYLQELSKSERSEISLMLLGICYEKQGNLPEAVRYINQAIADAPDRADLHSYLARVYRQMGKNEDADRHLARAKLLKLRVPQPK